MLALRQVSPNASPTRRAEDGTNLFVTFIETSIKNGVLIMALSTTPEARKKHKMIARKMA
jgi:hypothetical protein